MLSTFLWNVALARTAIRGCRSCRAVATGCGWCRCLVEVWNWVHVDISSGSRMASARGSATREATLRCGEPVQLQLWVRIFCLQSR